MTLPIDERKLSPAATAFNAALMKKNPATIYLVLPPKHLATHGVWLRRMVTSILNKEATP